MVIEVSKEIDVRRIGIDRYSLKTGLNLRTIMDISLQVMKEPRGFIRVIQCVMAILAFATTVGFSTVCEFNIDCKNDQEGERDSEYEIEYPFHNTEITIPECDKDGGEYEIELPFDFSNAAEFFVATGVLSFLYCLLILIVYIFFHQSYAQNNRIPVIDLGISSILAVFWLAGSSAWAQGVTDLKYYLHPDIVFKIIKECRENDCENVEDGHYGTLNASLILGFANFVLWICSLWFVYKETVFFQAPEAAPETNQNQQTKGAGRV